jgi:hypothetical protein
MLAKKNIQSSQIAILTIEMKEKEKKTAVESNSIL